MKRKLITIAWGLLALVLLVLNIQVATAHRWSSWHQPNTTLNTYNFATRHAEAEAALNDWDARTIFSLPRRTSHTEMSVFDGNFGDTGWWGLASIEDTGFGWWDCWWWCHIDHGHARYNSFYGGTGGTGATSDIRGIFCQEIGHLMGLTHSNTGDCMGKTYYNNINVTGPHNASDISAMY
jgi:hypothetical protein